MSDDLLAAVLDALLPADADWPGAGALGLAAAVRQDAGEALIPVLAALPADFAGADAERREAILQAIEAAQPRDFETLVTAAYTAYYTHPAVRVVIERLTGYEARPPQPLGYHLEPFDERLLEVQRRRAPFWRKP